MKTKYDWSYAKEWANYIATDNSGCIYQFSSMPIIDGDIWYLSDYINNQCLTFSFAFSQFNGDWQDSLEERPQ